VRMAILGNRGVPANRGGSDTATEEIGARLVERGHDSLLHAHTSDVADLMSFQGMGNSAWWMARFADVTIADDVPIRACMMQQYQPGSAGWQFVRRALHTRGQRGCEPDPCLRHDSIAIMQPATTATTPRRRPRLRARPVMPAPLGGDSDPVRGIRRCVQALRRTTRARAS